MSQLSHNDLFGVSAHRHCLLFCHIAAMGFLQDSQAQQTFVLEQVRKQAVDLGQATAAMPQRVEQMSSTLSGLEGGEIKLRVRALEVERAARRASIMQVCVLQVLCFTHIHKCFQRA